jgi:SecD/SecF fusion protein
MAIAGKGVSFSIDFESGTQIRAPLEQPADEAQIRSVLGEVGLPEANVQEVSGPGTPPNTVLIATEALSPSQIETVNRAVDEAFGGAEAYSATSIGPTFGETVARSAIIAVIISLLVISAYVTLRFEWRVAAPILIAIAHDLLITAGVYALLGAQVSTATVAAVLTIVGYSLYDTIIVFDRIRENTPRMPRAAYSQIANRSLSEVLVRSLATSFSTLLPVIALFIFGGETLRDFALALIVGTASGAYSSIFIACPVLALWKEREPLYRRRRRRIEAQLGHVPAYVEPGTSAATEAPPPEEPRTPRPNLVTPPDPQQGVSQEEWQQMMRDIAPEAHGPTATAERPADEEDAGDGAKDARTRDLSPDEVVMPGKERKPREPKRPRGGAASRRSRRHGRRR